MKMLKMLIEEQYKYYKLAMEHNKERVYLHDSIKGKDRNMAMILKLAEKHVAAIEEEIEHCKKLGQLPTHLSWREAYCTNCLAKGYCKWTLGGE